MLDFVSTFVGLDPCLSNIVCKIVAVQSINPMRVQSLTQALDFHYQAIASGVAQHAEVRRVEIEKEKAAAAAAAAASGL